MVQERVDTLVERFARTKILGELFSWKMLLQLTSTQRLAQYLADNLRQDGVMKCNFSRHDHLIEAPEFDHSYFKMNHEGAMMTPLWSYFYLLLQFMLSLPILSLVSWDLHSLPLLS